METLITQILNNNALLLLIGAVVAVAAILSIRSLSSQAYFGGGNDTRDEKRERYLRGEITTEEYTGYKSYH